MTTLHLQPDWIELTVASPPSGTGGTSFSVQAGQGALCEAIGGTEHFYGTFVNASGVREKVKITARTGDSFTIGTRGVDGGYVNGSTRTSGGYGSWATGDKFYVGINRSTLIDLLRVNGLIGLSGVTGTDTITASASPALASYEAFTRVLFVAAGDNTGAVTLNVDGLGAKALTKEGATALVAGDIKAGALVEAIYDGTRFQLVGVYGMAVKFDKAGGTITGSVTLSAGNLTVQAGTVTVGADVTGSVKISETGAIEVFRAAGAYIDFKDDSGADYDIRISQNVSNLQFTGVGAVVASGMRIVAQSPPADTYAITAQPTSTGYGAIIGYTQDGTKYGILGHANTYSLYGLGELRNVGRIHGTTDLLLENGVVYLNGPGSRYLQWDVANARYLLAGNTRLLCGDGYSNTLSGYAVINPDALIGRVNNAPGYLEWIISGGAYATTYTASDRKFKKNLRRSRVKALPVLRQIEWTAFDWRKKNPHGAQGHVPLGVVSQQLEEVNPDFIRTLSDGTKQPHEPTLLVYMGKALTELAAEVAALRAELARLKDR